MNRLHNLDYLRGIAAFSIMIYHYLSWTLGGFSSDTILGRLGIYGVAIFYVLSGLTLYHVYNESFALTKEKITSFFKKRIFRIFPLLWLVTILAILIAQKTPNFFDVFLNLSGLFGFVKWDTYFSAGIWSIGNELVFYAFFPFFMYFSKSKPILLGILSLAILSIFIYFTFFKLNPSVGLHTQSYEYKNPLNQVFFFLGGFLIGYFLKKIDIKKNMCLTILLVSILAFIFYPVTGNQINLVTGLNRLVFTIICFSICISLYKLSYTPISLIHKPLNFLGETSYSIYLVHPIVYNLTGLFFGFLSTNHILLSEKYRVLSSILLTVLLSYIVYTKFEKKFIKLGNTLNIK